MTTAQVLPQEVFGVNCGYGKSTGSGKWLHVIVTAYQDRDTRKHKEGDGDIEMDLSEINGNT
jgi:hypothetical protein